MSDSRFHLKVNFEVYGQAFEWEPSMNWSAAPGECDERVASWFSDCYEKAYSAFQAAQYKADAKQRKQSEEAEERAQLARLRNKYPDA